MRKNKQIIFIKFITPFYENFSLPIFSFCLPRLLIAQNYGSLNGRIIDVQTQQPLVGATILLEGTSYGVVTDETGYFCDR